MKASKLIYQGNKGFTLIELILSLFFAVIIISTLYSILNFSINAAKQGDILDELILNGRYGIEFIKNEIRNADKIISSDLIKDLNQQYPDNIGFVIVKKTDEIYSYVTYYSSNDKLVRIAFNSTSKSYPIASKFGGFNEICEYIKTIEDTMLDFKKNMIYLSISMINGKNNNEPLEFKTNLYVRCPIEN